VFLLLIKQLSKIIVREYCATTVMTGTLFYIALYLVPPLKWPILCWVGR